MRSMIFVIAKKLLPVKFRRVLIEFLNNIIINYIFFVHYVNLVRPIVWLWKKQLKTLNVNISNPKGTILVFNSPGGLADIESAYLNSKSPYFIKHIEGELIKASCSYFLGRGIEDYNSGIDKTNDEAREQYRDFLRKFLFELKNDINLIGIINFNHVYHAQVDVAKVASEMNIPFVTLLKECLRTPQYNLETEYVYKHIIKKYYGNKIAVHNLITKTLLLNSGIINDEQIEVVGQGRSDKLFSMRENKRKMTNDGSKNILYFQISETAGLPYFGGVFSPATNGKSPVFNWASLARDVWDLMIEYANSRSDVSLIVKGKPTGVYGEKLSNRNNNIEFIHGNPDMSLYEKADVVVAFNTTALAEAVAAGVPALTTYFGIDEEKMKPYLFDWYGSVDIMRTKDELFQKLDLYLFNDGQVDASEENVTKLLSQYLGNTDGEAGRRVRKFIDESMNIDTVKNTVS